MENNSITTPNDLTDTQFPTDAEGRVYHVGVRRGEGIVTLDFGGIVSKFMYSGQPSIGRRRPQES